MGEGVEVCVYSEHPSIIRWIIVGTVQFQESLKRSGGAALEAVELVVDYSRRWIILGGGLC